MENKSLTLYEITDTLPALLDSLDMTPPGSPERAECEAEIQRYFEALPSKVDGVARMIKHFEQQESFARKEIARLQARKKRFSAAAERLRNYVVLALENLPKPQKGQQKLEGNSATLALRSSRDRAVIADKELIPSEYRTIIPATTEVDMDAVEDALKRGVDVPGAILIQNRHHLVVL